MKGTPPWRGSWCAQLWLAGGKGWFLIFFLSCVSVLSKHSVTCCRRRGRRDGTENQCLPEWLGCNLLVCHGQYELPKGEGSASILGQTWALPVWDMWWRQEPRTSRLHVDCWAIQRHPARAEQDVGGDWERCCYFHEGRPHLPTFPTAELRRQMSELAPDRGKNPTTAPLPTPRTQV